MLRKNGCNHRPAAKGTETHYRCAVHLRRVDAAIIDPLRRVLKHCDSRVSQQRRRAAIIDPLRRVLKHAGVEVMHGSPERCNHRPAAKGTETLHLTLTQIADDAAIIDPLRRVLKLGLHALAR